MGNVVDYRKVKKVESDGRSFDSKAEHQMFNWLCAREQNGELSNIRHQQIIELLPGPRGFRRTYRVDFVATLANNEDVYFEVKGWETDRWKANKLLWRHLGPGVLQIWKVGWGKLAMVEEVVPNQKYIRERLAL